MTSAARKQETGALEALIIGYEERVNTVTHFMRRAAELLEQLGKEQDAMVEKLRETLAERRSLRRKDFDVMVEPILKERREHLGVLPATIEAFRQEETLLVGELRRMLTASTTDALGEWPELKKKMLTLERIRERRVSQALKRVHIEQEELSRALKGLLARGDRLRIADLKAVVREIDAISPQEPGELACIFKDCEGAFAEVQQTWQKVG